MIVQRIGIFVLIGISLMFFIIQPSVRLMPLLFGVTFLLQNKLPKFRINHFRPFIVFLFIFSFAMLFELSAAIEPYRINEFGLATRFSEGLSDNMKLGLGYHLPFALVWTWFLFYFRYTVRDVFVIGGTYGALTEQEFFVIKHLIFGNPIFIYTAFVLMLLYGSALTTPFILIKHLLPHDGSRSKWRLILPLLILFPIIWIFFGVFVLLF